MPESSTTEQSLTEDQVLPNNHTKKVMKGNIAAAVAAKLCRVSLVTAYPITPQTSIIEEITSMIDRGEFDATSVNMESEHSVFAALKGASLVGERVFTATSGQGLLYAHEVLHAIAHMRLPIVACNVGRPSFPWNIWADQTDSISQRDTGWIQFYCESSQEVLDTIIQSYKLAEKLQLPVMVVLDAFYLSHTSENVYLPDQSLADTFLPPAVRENNRVDTEQPRSFGGLVGPNMYDEYNRLYWEDINKVEKATNTIGREFSEIFGRTYGAVEAVNIHNNTKKILVTMATITTTARQVIDDYPDTGLLKIRLFKPFPKKSILEAMKPAGDGCTIITIDRNFTGDTEGALMQEMKRALFGKSVKISGVYAGLGGRDVSAGTIEKIINLDVNSPLTDEVTWIK
ncbi:MAG: pyruvate ferredoxin oxidoreductase [Balneolaceae bacterium]|nr:MAG: pyruvate ferredoxin oxidoreductase [Balneolaceae bacterium]